MRQVEGHDHVGTADDCRGDDVTVIGVGQFDALDQVLVARDQAVLDAFTDLLQGVFDLGGVLGTPA